MDIAAFIAYFDDAHAGALFMLKEQDEDNDDKLTLPKDPLLMTIDKITQSKQILNEGIILL